jgi:predicted nucleic acid-binding protein
MARLSIDTNILIHAADPSAGEKHQAARMLVARSAKCDTILTQQVIGEYLNVARKLPQPLQEAMRIAAERLCTVFEIAPTPQPLLFTAFGHAQRLRLQFWDCVIIAVCAAHGVNMLVTEDLQDGQVIDGVSIVDPFAARNAETISRLLEE